MKINGKQGVFGKAARGGLWIAALLAMVLTCALGGRAQSSATTAPGPDSNRATPPAGYDRCPRRDCRATRRRSSAADTRPSRPTR